MKEKYPKVKVIYQRRKKNISLTKPSTIEVEISFQGKRKWISTGIRVLPKNWSNKLRVVGLPDAIDANLKIESVERKVLNHIRQLMIDGKPFDWSSLSVALDNSKAGDSFIKFVENRVITRRDIKDSTRRNHKKLIVALREFKQIESFNDLVRSNVIKFDEWLRARKDYTQTTIASYHRYLKTYINEAIRMELIQFSPYNGYKVDNGKPAKRKFLLQEDLVKIETYKLNSCSLEKVRDLFVFQCYTGLAYSDLKKFNFNDVRLQGNRYVLHDVRKKTEEDFYIVLLPSAMSILQKYNYKLPIISLEQYNMRLKIVAEHAGVQKNLTSHMGRHTFATMSLNSGIKIEVLAQMMGHSDIKTTQIYAKMVNRTVEEAYVVLENNENVKSMVYFLNDVLSLLLKALKPKE